MDRMKLTLFKLSSLLFYLLYANSVYANEIFVDQVGDDLTLSITQQGRGHYSRVYTTGGDHNTFTVLQQNNSTTNAGGHSSNISLYSGGDYNNISVTQKGDGDHESHVGINNGETHNTISITQDSNTGDHVSNVSVYHSGNTIAVDQTGSGTNTAYVIFSGVGPTNFTLDQTGGKSFGDPSTGTAATVNCGSVNGCTVTVSQ